jgi:hypothetical protein
MLNLGEFPEKHPEEAKEPLNKFHFHRNLPSVAKARHCFVLFAARLKSCPFKT